MNKPKVNKLYNIMYFNESESMKYNQNNSFWEKLCDLAIANPGLEITVNCFLVHNKRLSHLLEDVRVVCNQSKFQKICDDIYQRHYYLAPMILHKEFEGKDELMRDLLENDSSHSE